VSYCPCGTKKDYHQCCGLFISGEQLPSTPEELMRSRYTAYHQVNMDYIARTMKSPALDHFDKKAASEWANQVKWIQLEIVKTKKDDTHGIVEFRAYYIINNKEEIMHEVSEFKFENGRWYYIDSMY